MVENVSHNQVNTTLNVHKSSSLETSRTTSTKLDGKEGNPLDTVTLKGETTLSATYSSDMRTTGASEDKYGIFRDLVTNLLKEQGIETTITLGEEQIDINSLTAEDAKELVAEDGYFGVDQTSERIFQFAMGVSGGDPSRIDAIKEGVEKGFQQALNAFGGELPEISYQTFDAVMEKLDKWVADSEAVA